METSISGINSEIRLLENKIFELRQRKIQLEKTQILNNALLKEISDIDGWVINTDGRYYICSNPLQGTLIRSIYDAEIDIVHKEMVTN